MQNDAAVHATAWYRSTRRGDRNAMELCSGDPCGSETDELSDVSCHVLSKKEKQSERVSRAADSKPSQFFGPKTTEGTKKKKYVRQGPRKQESRSPRNFNTLSGRAHVMFVLCAAAHIVATIA